MSVNVEYCLDDEGTGAICLKIYDGDQVILHTKAEYPYQEIPTNDITNLVESLRTLYVDSLTNAGNATDAQIPRASWIVQDIGLKLSQLITIRNGRDDYGQ